MTRSPLVCLSCCLVPHRTGTISIRLMSVMALVGAGTKSEQFRVHSSMDGQGRNALQCALEGLCGPRSRMPRRDCQKILEQLIRLYPSSNSSRALHQLLVSPHLNRQLLGIMLSVMETNPEVRAAPQVDYWLFGLIFRILTEPPTESDV